MSKLRSCHSVSSELTYHHLKAHMPPSQCHSSPRGWRHSPSSRGGTPRQYKHYHDTTFPNRRSSNTAISEQQLLHDNIPPLYLRTAFPAPSNRRIATHHSPLRLLAYTKSPSKKEQPDARLYRTINRWTTHLRQRPLQALHTIR